MRRFRSLIWFILVTSVACGGSSSSPTTTTTTTIPPAVTVTAVSVTGSTPAIGAGTQFTANASFSNGTSQSVTAQASWQSSNNAVATVSAAGVVTGLAAGDADISATYQNVTGRMHVTLSRSTTGFTVSGTVTDGTSGGVLPNIAIGSSDGKTTTTASNGTYSIGSIASGNLTLTASATGYDDAAKTVAISGDARVDFVLTRKQSQPVPLTGSISVQNLPCVAPATGNVTCTFVAAASGGAAPYTFAWKFTNPGNSQVVTSSGQQATPPLGCNFAPYVGVATFNVSIELTITPATGSAVVVPGTQQIAREKGSCGL